MKHIQVAVGVVENTEGEILITRRQKGQHLAGLWEFPGGKVERDESPAAALIRELSEEVGLTVSAPQRLFTIDHSYTEKKVSLLIFLVKEFAGKATGREGQALQWVAKSGLRDFDFPEANEAILEYLDV